jgi:hypothetical protein
VIGVDAARNEKRAMCGRNQFLRTTGVAQVNPERCERLQGMPGQHVISSARDKLDVDHELARYIGSVGCPAGHMCVVRRHAKPGTSSHPPSPVHREARAEAGRSIALLAWAKRAPSGGGGGQRGAERAGAAPCGRPCESTGATASPPADVPPP